EHPFQQQGRQEVDRARAPRARAVRRRARRLHRQRGAALDRPRPRVLAGEPPVGRQRLHARLRRLPPPRRPHGRPPRAAAPVHRRPHPLRRRLAAGRLRADGGPAHRLPRAAGPRRGAHLARRALHRHDALHRGRRAQQGARGVGRGGRRRRRGRRAARRRAHGVPRLGVGAVRQHAHHHRRGGHRPPPARREPLGRREPPLRRRGRGHGDRRTVAARLRAGRRQRRGLGLDPDDRPAGPHRGPARDLRRGRAALQGPARPLPGLPAPDPAGREHHRAADRHGALLDVLLHLALHAAGARLRRPEGRLRLPAARPDDHRVRGRRLPARHQGRLQAGARGGPRADRRRPRVVLAGVDGRHVRGGRAVPVAARGRRPRLRVRAGHDRRGDRCEQLRGGARVRPDQHLAADRRRARPGRPRRGRDQRDRRPGRRPARAGPGGAHGGLPGRVPHRGGLRRGRRAAHAPADLEPRLQGARGGGAVGRCGGGARGGL
ncbi:MAG: Uncharacterized MFS-type transporter, partial [uncultured Solirubrobacteraceae bacterium]